jgi:hypothetical protein
MKNCELNIRTIDEGAMDEKSGMNFSEYIAILSGDTSLLEKSKLEKKVAVMESLKTAHYREVSRSKFQLENLQHEKVSTIQILEKLTSDELVYKSSLRYEKDGTKLNPIQLNGISTDDPEVIGKHLIKLYQNWKPNEEPKIGNLYGFDLYIRQQREAFEEKGSFEYRYYNTLYAERPESGIKYTYNQGHPNTDNPKLAARYFLNAIDRVEKLKEKYQKTLNELEKNIPMIASLANKPFEKESELMQMKSDLSKLEREITIKIQENQMKQNGTINESNTEIKKQNNDDVQKEAPVIHMTPKEDKPMKVIMTKVNGASVNGKEHYQQNQVNQPGVRRSNRLRI